MSSKRTCGTNNGATVVFFSQELKVTRHSAYGKIHTMYSDITPTLRNRRNRNDAGREPWEAGAQSHLDLESIWGSQLVSLLSLAANV